MLQFAQIAPEDLQGRVQCSMVLEKCGIVAGHHGSAKWGRTRRASCMERQRGAGPQDARTRAQEAPEQSRVRLHQPDSNYETNSSLGC